MYQEIKKEDLKAMSKLFKDVFNEAPWNDHWTEELAYKRLQDFFNTPGFDGLLEYEEGKLVALILGCGEQYYNGVSFRIIEFCVDHEKQGKGYGSKILEHFKLKLKEKGVHDIFLLTCHGHSTEGFYGKNGFKTNEHMIVMNTL